MDDEAKGGGFNGLVWYGLLILLAVASSATYAEDSAMANTSNAEPALYAAAAAFLVALAAAAFYFFGRRKE